MKHIAFWVLAVLAIPTMALAQPQDDAINTALQALPPNLRADATVIKWKPDFTYETLRKGTNGLVCFDRSGMPEQQPVSIECTSEGNLPREAQNLKAESVGDKAKTQAMLDAMIANDPYRKGNVWQRVDVKPARLVVQNGKITP